MAYRHSTVSVPTVVRFRDASHDVLRLNGVDVRSRDLSGQDRIFSLCLEAAPVARFAPDQVDFPAKVHVDAVAPQFRYSWRIVYGLIGSPLPVHLKRRSELRRQGISASGIAVILVLRIESWA